MDNWHLKAIFFLFSTCLGVLGFLIRYIWVQKDNKISDLSKELKAAKTKLELVSDDLLKTSANMIRHGVALEQAVTDLKIIGAKVEKVSDVVSKHTIQFENAAKILRDHEDRLREYGKIIYVKDRRES